MSDLQRLLRRLDDAGIEFVLVGGYAAMLHGSSLLTRDVDVCAILTINLLSRITGVGDYARVARDAVDVDVCGMRVRAISLDDLIASKEALGREKDLIAAKELRAVRAKLRGGSVG